MVANSNVYVNNYGDYTLFYGVYIVVHQRNNACRLMGYYTYVWSYTITAWTMTYRTPLLCRLLHKRIR